jgi:glutathione S-transferase
MGLRLYVVHGSSPCAAVEKALALKGRRYAVTEWPPPLHPLFQMVLFGQRTVPALRDGDERVVGSRAIMRWLEGAAPEHALYPIDPELRQRVLEAERWGEEELQQVARDLVWAGLANRPGALLSYSEHSQIGLPGRLVQLAAPLITNGGRLLNGTGNEGARARLRGLPGQLDRIEWWMGEGTLGAAEHPNAADLQIFSTVRLLTTIEDCAPVLEGRRASAFARELFPAWDGTLPAGAIPPGSDASESDPPPGAGDSPGLGPEA